MKLLDDALAAAGFSARFKILTEIPVKQYPALLEAIREKREDLKQEQAISWPQDHPDRESVQEEIRKKILCVEAAEMLAYQAKKKLPSGFRPSRALLEMEEVVVFLAARSPAWLPELFRTQRKFCQPVGIVYRYLQAGAIPPPPDGDPYYMNLFEFIRIESNGEMAKARQFLTNNTDLVTRDLPIRIGGKGGPHSRQHIMWPAYHIRSEDGFSIYKAISDLCGSGVFEMAPLLVSITEMLAEIPGESDARHFINELEELAPTPADCLEAQASFFSLLMARHKSCARAAVDFIATMGGLPGFDARGFVDHVASVFLHPSNPLHLAALKVVKDVVPHHPEIAARIPTEISSALLNANLKTQSAVLAILQALPKSEASRISEAIAPFADHILPTLRSGFAPWLKAAPACDEPAAAPVENFQETGSRLEPIQSADDLAFVASGLLNRDPEPLQFELLLDGLARFAAPDRAALAGAFAPLKIRVEQSRASQAVTRRYTSLLTSYASELIVALCVDADGGDHPGNPFHSMPDTSVWPVGVQKEWDDSVLNFLWYRCGEVVAGILNGRSAPLLGTPEFELGFISPATLVERVRSLAESGLEALHFDFIQAIARCQLAGQGESIETPRTDDEVSRVVHFLLSGEIRGEIQTPAWWLTAARAREPSGDFFQHPHFSKYHLAGEPDWSEPVRYQSLSEYGINWRDAFGPEHPRFYPGYAPNHLYSLQHTTPKWPCDIRWRYSCTPGLLDAAVASDLQHSYPDLSWGVVKNDAPAAVMAEFAIRRLPLRHAMRVHLLVALNSPDTPTREAATELIIQASQDGRLADVTAEMGGVFSEILRGGPVADPPVFQMNRMLPCLRELAMNGPVLRLQLRDILFHGLAQPPASIPKGFPSLLELLLELVSAHPPEVPFDLNAAWNGLLDGKSKALATRITKAVLSRK